MGGTLTVGALLGPEGTDPSPLCVSGSPGAGGVEFGFFVAALAGLARLCGLVGVFVCCLRITQWTRASLIFCGQVFKSARWMPGHQEPMKDVGGCDKPRGAVNRAVIRGFPNGETQHESCRVTRI
jgi:hypothetical protein